MHPGVHAADRPDHPAQIWGPTGEITTYRELDAASNQLAHVLRAAGLRTGDHVAVYMENHPRFLPIVWAAHRSGLFYTAISSRLTAEEAAYIASDCGARAVITSHAKREVAGRLPPLVPDVHTWLMVDGTVDGYESFEALVDDAPTTPLPDQTAGVDMLYSSGTTGRPKGVKRRLDAFPLDGPNGLQMLCEGLFGFTTATVYLSPAPQYHSAPLLFSMTVQRIGGTVVVMDRFDPRRTLELVEQHRVTHAQFVPTMFLRMLKLPEGERTAHDLSSLRWAVHAAAPCPVDAKRSMIEWWGPVIWEYYSATEGAGFCAITPQEWLEHPGSVGRALIGAIHITDDEGNERPTGEAGTIWFESDVEVEYHNDPDKTRESTHARGWKTVGDVGYVDEDGYLYLTDRKAFMIISGGVNIYPQETENVLAMHPKVADAAVIGVPNDDFGEEVKAVVQPAAGVAADDALGRELIAYCREHLADVKCPRSVDFVDELPRAETGKLYKRLLRDRYWAGQASTI